MQSQQTNALSLLPAPKRETGFLAGSRREAALAIKGLPLLLPAVHTQE
jgi:hypothetical protein